MRLTIEECIEQMKFITGLQPSASLGDEELSCKDDEGTEFGSEQVSKWTSERVKKSYIYPPTPKFAYPVLQRRATPIDFCKAFGITIREVGRPLETSAETRRSRSGD